MKRRPRTKFGVYTDPEGIARRTFKGKVYPSILERDHAEYLDTLRRCGEVKSVTEQPQFTLHCGTGEAICVYQSDFLVVFPDNHIEIHETKGKETEAYKLKEAWFRAEYPTYKLVVITKESSRDVGKKRRKPKEHDTLRTLLDRPGELGA